MFDRIRTLGVDGKYPTNCGPYEIRYIRDLTAGMVGDDLGLDNSGYLLNDKVLHFPISQTLILNLALALTLTLTHKRKTQSNALNHTSTHAFTRAQPQIPTRTGYDNSQANNVAILPVNKSIQMITVTFVNGCRATLRTSGTEPKVKYYAEMIGQPKNPNEEEEGEEDGANANQEEEEDDGIWRLDSEKSRIQSQLDAVIKTIIDEWFAL